MALPKPFVPGPETPPNPFTGLVSVILASYNSASTLPDSIHSLQNQTYKNIEIIVADDGSTDNTAELVRLLGVRYVRAEKNGGPAAARNMGAREALGEVLLFGESDGWYDDDYIEKILRHLHLPGVVGGINLGRKVWTDRNSALVRLQNDQFAAICDLVESGKRGTGAWAFPRDAFWSVSGYDEQCVIGSDVDLVNRLLAGGGRTVVGGRSCLHHKDPDTWRAMWKRSFRGGYNSGLYRERWYGMKGNARRALYVLKYAALALWPAYLIATTLHSAFALPFVAGMIFLLREDPTTWLAWRTALRRGDFGLAVMAAPILWWRRLAIGYGRIRSFFV